MLEQVNMFLIQFRDDSGGGVPIEDKLFVGTIRNWHKHSCEVEEMFRARGLLEAKWDAPYRSALQWPGTWRARASST